LLINIGYDNSVESDLVAVTLNSGSTHAKNMRMGAEQKGALTNATAGHKARSVIVLSTNQVFLSSLQTTTFTARVNRRQIGDPTGERNSSNNITLINIGYDNFMRGEFIAAALIPDSSHAKNIRHEAKEKGTLINATSGHRTRSVIVLSTNQVVLCSLQTTTFAARVNKSHRHKTLINIGYDNFLRGEFVAGTLVADSTHATKTRNEAKEKGILINATSGHKTRSLAVMITKQVVLCSLRSPTLSEKINKYRNKQHIDPGNDGQDIM